MPTLMRLVKQNWFLFALAGICVITLIDATGTIEGMGKWFKSHRGADAVIFTIFLGSGLILQREQIRAGLRDISGALMALVLIFAVAPLTAFALGFLPLDPAARIGLFLVSVMPTTMSSGVVMTGASGGNIAHALLITVVANSLSIVTIPFSLSLLVQTVEAVPIDKGHLMFQMALLVLLPLMLGLLLRPRKKSAFLTSLQRGIPMLNQCLILAIVWMGVSDARATVLGGGAQVFVILAVAFFFHAILLAAGFLCIRLFRIPRGRMESILFMGGQKTLPLSVLFQVKLFPQYGLALAFCVIHHFIHLVMDGYLVGRLKRVKK
jgi:sodium/bile acid cotransporter 7